MIKNILYEKMKGYRLILASNSPRRQQFFRELGLDFEVHLKKVEEVYPPTLQGSDIARHLSKLKASPFKENLATHDIVVTSDTVVWHNHKSLAKAADLEEAYQMLKTLSGDWHEVTTAVTFTTAKTQITVHHTTKVKFKALLEAEIRYYVNTFRPLDKAGAYGIQDWLGLIGIEEIQGSYTNVVGLPTHLVYETLMDMVS